MPGALVGQKGISYPRIRVLDDRRGCWGLDLGLLEVYPVLLTTVLSLQPFEIILVNMWLFIMLSVNFTLRNLVSSSSNTYKTGIETI